MHKAQTAASQARERAASERATPQTDGQLERVNERARVKKNPEAREREHERRGGSKAGVFSWLSLARERGKARSV